MHLCVNDVNDGRLAMGERTIVTGKIFRALVRLSEFQVGIGVKEVGIQFLPGTKIISVPQFLHPLPSKCNLHHSRMVHSMLLHLSQI